ncbi:expressed unknown protein [Seminavis robusta]|uniref:Uncharacterized protein n=1 Tax=Seminavis robusta TaxID=568900 RepID=A0A9N8HXE6_9STRA|nr:expressed unknown protein [Seminavis robusta]|eukprot:Sro2435_g327540.1 n/a (277) ;mRNA; f:2023-2853
MATTETLREFRRLAKVSESQSLVEDLIVLTGGLPVLAVPVALLAALLYLSYINQSSKSQDLKKNNSGESIYPSPRTVMATVTAFAVCHSINYDLSRLPSTLLGGRTTILDDNYSTSTTNTKPYSDFATFYHEAYVDFHVTAASRLSHCFLATSVAMIWISDTRLGVASIIALLTGALATIPLLACPIPFVEMALVVTTGIAVTQILCSNPHNGTMTLRWFAFFVTWALLDYLDHYLSGRNGSAAMYVGQHYISWALIGQLQLAFHMVSSGVTHRWQ